MAKRRKRRRWLRHAREVAGVALPLAALLWLLAAILSGAHVVTLVLVPVFLLASALASPDVLLVLLLLAVTVLVAALSLASLAAAFRLPLLVLYRLLAGPRRAGGEGLTTSLSPEALLRRRYVAGEITYEQFQTGMVGCLKDRCTRGELGVSEYEAELEKVLGPARTLDVAHDPAVAGRLRGP